MKNLFCVQDRVIVITGATGVLGRPMVLHFAEQGARVVFMGRRTEAILNHTPENGRAAGSDRVLAFD